MKKLKSKKPIVVAVSGGFDPLHEGHIRYLREAKKLGDVLIVILNNDHWLRKKKGVPLLPLRDRKTVLEALAVVDKVMVTSHTSETKDMSVCRELKKIKPHIFANGGDRKKTNIPEVAVCNKINCSMVFGVGRGGKIQSSSWILKKYVDETRRRAAEE